MPVLQSIDTALFRFINGKLGNPLLDAVMPQFSSNAWFIPLLLLGGGWLLWKGGVRARLLVLMLALVLGLGDSLVINRVKKAVARPRPGQEIADARLRVGRGGSGSMPSSHSSTWFAATLITFVYYRRSWRFLLPLSCVMGFSRVYLGAHYPSDVLAGAILGAGYAAAGLWLVERSWRWIGQQWFPLWWRQLPSLLNPAAIPSTPPPASPAEEALREQHWLRLGYVVIACLLGARLLYLASGFLELSEDEAYQWVWSKHLALSYYSKPPLIALLHRLGTSIWGDTTFGVRFTPPILSAILAFTLLRFFSRAVGARVSFLLVLIASTTPILAAGSILLTIDPPLVLFWCLAMCAVWNALQPEGTTGQWVWAGVWIALAFLSKYTALFFFLSLALYFLLRPEARTHLRRPGPWLALLPLLLAFLPVAIWNAQNGWVTLQHVSENAKLDKPWQPTARFFLEFTAGEAGLLNPVYFVAILIAAIRFWPAARRRPLELYLFTMGAPVFAIYWLYTLHSRVQMNWVACGVVPLLGLALLYWERRWREGSRAIVPWLAAGLLLGTLAVFLLHNTDLVRKVARVDLPVSIDPTRRVRGIREMTEHVGVARRELQASEGRETFVIAAHYGFASQLSFYLPEARRGLPGAPLAYVRSSHVPRNQFYFWPEYRYEETRVGQNAIFVALNDKPEPAPQDLQEQFESVTDLGMREVILGGRQLHLLQLYACRNLLRKHGG